MKIHQIIKKRIQIYLKGYFNPVCIQVPAGKSGTKGARKHEL
jgi:hypothetical protein